MPDPPDPNARDVVPRSSDQASSFPPQDPRFANYSPRLPRNAPEGNAYAPGGYATPSQAFPQSPPLIYPNQSPQQQHQIAPHPFPSYCSFDPYAHAAWDWTQSLGYTQLPTPYEPQGELVQELSDQRIPSETISNPLRADPLAPPPRPLPQRPALSPKMKRKSQSEAQDDTKRRAVSRASSTTSQSPAPTVLADAQASPIANVAQIAAQANQSSIHNAAGGRKSAGKGTGPQGREIDVSEPRRVVESSGSADMLPASRVFPIQIGSALFRLSGASLCSDAPSYFSHFFSDQLHSAAGRATDIRTLYIDRDPDTFRDIALHLQGYHIVPRDGEHFVKLFADAQFYSLPRLTKQLFRSDIFIAIGGVPFRIPRDSFATPGNSPNYFSLGFAQWFSTPAEVFPGLDRNALLRPPSISPPSVPNKSGEVFAELMKMLMGYEVEIRSPEHRANLLRDARYFHLKGLEQKLIKCEMSYNLKKERNEILIRLEDIRQSGVGYLPDEQGGEDAKGGTFGGSVTYARPYTDDASLNHHLILETSSNEPATMKLIPFSLQSGSTRAYVSFQGDTLRRINALLNIVATKAGTDSLSKSPFKVTLDGDTSLVLNGAHTDVASNAIQKSKDLEWIIRGAHWRVRVEGFEMGPGGETELQAVLEAVKIDAYTQERGRNAARGFLSA
ncbi:hypothetical protein E8E11_010301 [Didymella keratinophila]|nr:hypothetical protein E8E11_010301 [Didymella keratinophila]